MGGHDTGQHVVHNVYNEGLYPGADWSGNHTKLHSFCMESHLHLYHQLKKDDNLPDTL